MEKIACKMQQEILIYQMDLFKYNPVWENLKMFP